MNLDQMSTKEVITLFLFMNAGIALVLGLITLVIGLAKGQRRYGIIGFVVSLVGGTLFGVVVSIPALIIFTWLIIRASRRAGQDLPVQPDDGFTA